VISDDTKYYTGENINGEKVSGTLKIYKGRYFIDNEHGEFEVKLNTICRYGETKTVLSEYNERLKND